MQNNIDSPAIPEWKRDRTLERTRDIVLKHGWNSTSYQIINPGIRRWFSTAGDAVVGYVEARSVRVVAGAPVCSKERLPAVVAEFEQDAAADGSSVCYFGAEARLDGVLEHKRDHSKVLLGAQPAWRPENWREIVQTHRSIRAQLNRARNKGVIVTEWPAERALNDPLLETCLHRWLETKGLPPLHFVVEPETLSRLEHRRIFVAEHSDSVVGFLVLSPVATRNGWLFEQFPHCPGAPNGTVELMIDAAMNAVANDGSSYVTLGLAPLSRRALIPPFENPLWLRILLAWLRKHGQRFYNFDGLDAFKAKLQPERWEPVFAISNEPSMSLRTLHAIADAFSGNATMRMIALGLSRALKMEIRRFDTFIRG